MQGPAWQELASVGSPRSGRADLVTRSSTSSIVDAITDVRISLWKLPAVELSLPPIPLT